MTGSKYFSKVIDLEEAYAFMDLQGTTFKDAILNSRLPLEDESVIGRGKTAIDAFVELHVEQGPILEKKEKQIGVVESIVGNLKYDVSFEGAADHAGTTPMNLRKDALLAASKLVQGVNALARKIKDSVGTVGFLDVSPNAPNVVPRKVRLIVDFRHHSDKTLEIVRKDIEKLFLRTCKTTNVDSSLKVRSYLKPASMIDRIKEAIEASSRELGLRCMRLRSGAGHDSMILSRIVDTGMIFVPSKAGKSHSTLEQTDPEDLVNGANVLANTLVFLASS